MKNKKKVTIFKKELYEKLVNLIGKLSYRVFESTDRETNEIFDFAKKNCKFLTLTTGPAIDMRVEYLCEDFTVPMGKEVIVIKHLRQDFDNPKGLHLNTDFWALVPTTHGEVLRVPIEDKFKEHIIKLEGIEKFFKLDYWPRNKSGTVQELYTECKAPIVKLELKENKKLK